MKSSAPTTTTSTNTSGIEQLRIYQLARSLEDKLYELAKALPEDQAYPLGNDLRRSAAAVAHHVAESHRRYSYTSKIEELHAARIAAEEASKVLERDEEAGHGKVAEYAQDYTGVIKQSWGLIKWLKNKQLEQKARYQAKASDELVQARA
jgi:four helix bundle protein